MNPIRFGWQSPEEGVQESTFATASEAIREMGKRICPEEKNEGQILATAERIGFRLVLVECHRTIRSILTPQISLRTIHSNPLVPPLSPDKRAG